MNTKQRVLAALLLTATLGFAQPGAFHPGRASDAQAKWDAYLAMPPWPAEARAELLIRIERELAPTAANVSAAVARLGRTSSMDEERSLVRLLGQLHFKSPDTAVRATIERLLVSLAAAPGTQKAVATAAVTTYSRMGYFGDSIAVVNRAQAAGLLHPDDYYRELVVMVAGAPSADQLKLLRMIRAGNNAFGLELMADLLVHRETVESLETPVLQEAQALLADREPGFSSEPGSFGVSSMKRYQDWMMASVLVDSRVRGEPHHVNMARRIKFIESDPRKLLSVLATEPTAPIARAGLDRAAVRRIDAVLVDYARQHPQSLIRETTAEARTTLAAP